MHKFTNTLNVQQNHQQFIVTDSDNDNTELHHMFTTTKLTKEKSSKIIHVSAVFSL